MLCVCVQLLSCVQLFETLWMVTHQAPLSLGFSRQEYLSVLPCPPPGDIPDPWVELASLMSPALVLCCFSHVWLFAALCTVACQAPFSISSVQFSHSVMSDSLQPRELQHARPPCPSPTPGVHSNSYLSSRWCHPAISSSVIPFSSCPQSLPASGSFQWVNSSHEVAKILEFQF